MRRNRSRSLADLPRLVLILVSVVLVAAPALADGGRVSGQAVDEAGKPVSGVRLRLVSDSGEPASGVPPIDVKNGRFTIPSFPSGFFRLEVEGDQLVILRFEILMRGSGGVRLGDMATDVPAGAKAPTFQVAGSQRGDVKLVVGKAAPGGGGGAAVAAARETSAAVQKLNDLLAQGDMPALLSESEKVLATKPDLPGARYLHAVALWKTGRVEDGVAELRRAAVETPDQPGLQSVLGAMLVDLSNVQKEAGKEAEAKAAASEAVDIFSAQVAANPSDVGALTNRVIALERAGRSEETVQAIQTLIAADPANTKAYYRCSEILMDAGNYKEAVGWLEKAPAKDAETATRIYNVGVSLYNKGQMQEVADAMRKAIAMAPDLAFLHQLMGRALLSLGDNAGAIKEFEEFVRLAPDDPDAENTRALIKAIR